MAKSCVTSARTTSACRCEAAHMRAVCPAEFSVAFVSAPRASSASTASTLPERAHCISGVTPVTAARFGFADPLSVAVVVVTEVAFALDTDGAAGVANDRTAPKLVPSLFWAIAQT